MNTSALHSGRERRDSRWLSLFLAICVLPATIVFAGDVQMCAGRDLHGGKDVQPLTNREEDTAWVPFGGRHWEMSLESSYSFGNVPNPFFAVAGHKYINPDQYRLATQVLAVRYQLYKPCGPWFLRGTMEASANVVGSLIIEGHEDYFVGFELGLRYYFVQPGWKIAPYIEMRGGPGQTNSEGSHFAQQRDLAFGYLAGVGLRYDANRRWSATISMVDQHLSNGYLAKPNNGYDSLGVQLGAIYGF